MLRFVSNVGAEVSTDDAMPSWIVLFVEFFLDVSGDVFFDIVPENDIQY